MASAYLISRRLPSLVEIGATLLPKRHTCSAAPEKNARDEKPQKTKFFGDAPVASYYVKLDLRPFQTRDKLSFHL